MSIGLKSDSSGTSGSIVINGSDAVLVTTTGITTASIQNSSVTTAKITDGNITFAKLSTSATEADNVASRTAKAWVNFDGTNAFSPNPSTTAIRASFNVSSITDNGAGDYTINFTVAMSDTNYCAVGSTGPKGTNSESLTISSYVSTSAVRVVSSSGGGIAADAPNINCVIFR